MTIGKVVFSVCVFTTVMMLVAGFLLPPTGVIDSSVLKAVGELFGFATLGQLPSIIHGRSVEFKHNDTTITLGDND